MLASEKNVPTLSAMERVRWKPDTTERRARLKGDVHPKNMNERNKGTNVSTDTWPYLFLLEGHFKIIGGTCKYGRTVCACPGQGHPSVERTSV